MQAIGDIFTIWDSIGEMAVDLDREYDTVLAWRTRKRIPEDAWSDVIAAAAKRGKRITLEQLLALNAPMKQRGRPAHDPKPRRRKRSRPESRTAA